MGRKLLAAGLDFAYYQVQVVTDETFATLVLDIHQPGLGNPEFLLTSDLAADTKFHWGFGHSILPDNNVPGRTNVASTHLSSCQPPLHPRMGQPA